MRALTRFWFILGGVVVAVGSFGYLFLSMTFPETGAFVSSQPLRLSLVVVGAVASSLFVWAAVALEPAQPDGPPSRE